MLIYSTSCFRHVSCSIGTYLSVPVLTYMYICDLEQTLDTLPQLTPPIKAPRRQLVASWCHTPPTVPNGRPTVAARAPSGGGMARGAVVRVRQGPAWRQGLPQSGAARLQGLRGAGRGGTGRGGRGYTEK